MAAWNNTNLVPKAEAANKIQEMATAQGIRGTFKVFYNGTIITDPSELPEQVDMTKIKVSNVLDQASV